MRKALEAFNGWFASPNGVWQTFAVTIAIAVVELMDPALDPHGFWLLWALTIYSGITQPALALVSAESADRLDHLLAHVEALENRELELLERIAGGEASDAVPPEGEGQGQQGQAVPPEGG